MPSYAVFGLGPLELAIIAAIVVLLFLPALLPKLARRLGETVTTLKDMASKGLDEGGGEGGEAEAEAEEIAAPGPGDASDKPGGLPKGPSDNGGSSRDAPDSS
jgi:Sec-independent protein translocase protein TatA